MECSECPPECPECLEYAECPECLGNSGVPVTPLLGCLWLRKHTSDKECKNPLFVSRHKTPAMQRFLVSQNSGKRPTRSTRRRGMKSMTALGHLLTLMSGAKPNRGKLKLARLPNQSRLKCGSAMLMLTWLL